MLPKKECRRCVNNTNNPAVKIDDSGLCGVCRHYLANFDEKDLQAEFEFFKSFAIGQKFDAMVGISGGKDSTATLYTVKQLGFSPLAFTFKIGYLPSEIFSQAKQVADSLGIEHKIIDINEYVNEREHKSFGMMADLYDEEVSEDLKKKFKDLYAESRKCYSTKQDVAFPFVRPCQICRKIAIRAYYGEAIKRGMQVVVIGINEWTGLSDNSYSAIRKLQPDKTKPPVYIVHLPFLLQRKFEDTKKILDEIGWKKPEGSVYVDTGGGSCLLAKACEKKAANLLGFNLDSTRLAREVTVGFITKEQAKSAMSLEKKSAKTVRQVLADAGLL